MLTNGPKASVWVVVGVIILENLSPDARLQVAFPEQPHFEIKIEVASPSLDISSPAPSGAPVQRGIPLWNAL